MKYDQCLTSHWVLNIGELEPGVVAARFVCIHKDYGSCGKLIFWYKLGKYLWDSQGGHHYLTVKLTQPGRHTSFRIFSATALSSSLYCRPSRHSRSCRWRNVWKTDTSSLKHCFLGCISQNELSSATHSKPTLRGMSFRTWWRWGCRRSWRGPTRSSSPAFWRRVSPGSRNRWFACRRFRSHSNSVTCKLSLQLTIHLAASVISVEFNLWQFSLTVTLPVDIDGAVSLVADTSKSPRAVYCVPDGTLSAHSKSGFAFI